MSAVPELQDELNRKAFETIEWLYGAVERGAISEAQFSTGVDTLFMAVSGLVKEDLLSLVTAAGSIASGAATTVKRCFLKDDCVVVLERELGGTTIIVSRYKAGVRSTGKSSALASSAATKAGMEAMAGTLLTGGYAEL